LQDPQIERAFFNGFPSGYYPNRNPLAPPSDRGEDVLIDGGDLLHTDHLTWLRRPGLSKWSNQAVSSATNVQSFFSQELVNSVNVFADRTTDVYEMTTTSATVLFNKGISTQNCYFASVGDSVYITHGGLGATNANPHKKKVEGHAVKQWGINNPAAAPTIAHGGNTGQRVRIGWKYVYVYEDTSDGHISSASPISADTGNFLNDVVSIDVVASSEARVDKICIYRTKDGGSTFFFHSRIANTTATITDTTPDDDLNDALIAPIADVNDPPPQLLKQICEHQGRLWGIAGDKVYFNGDSTNGVREECWPATNFFKFSTYPKAILSTSQGLLVFTSNKIYLVDGVLVDEFSVRQLRSRLGVLSQFCVANDGDIVYLYSTFKEILRISDRVENIGLPLDPDVDLDTFNPATSHLTVHREGSGGSLYLSDNNGKVLRFGFETETWSPMWNLGADSGGAIASLQTSIGNYDILIGPKSGQSGFVHKVDPTTFSDDGDDIEPFATFGNLMLAPPEGLGVARRAFIQQLGASVPTLSFRPEEVGSVAAFSTVLSQTDEPPNLPQSSSMKSFAWNFAANDSATPLICRHVQVKLEWDSDAEATELLTFGLNYASSDT